MDPSQPYPFYLVHKALKFSAVKGTTSLNNSNSILPAALSAIQISKKTLGRLISTNYMYKSNLFQISNLKYRHNVQIKFLQFYQQELQKMQIISEQPPQKLINPSQKIINLSKRSQSLQQNRPFKHAINRDGAYSAKLDYIQAELFSHHIVEHNIHIQSLVSKLRSMFRYHMVDNSYSYFFFSQLAIAPQARIQDNLNLEINALKEKRSHHHKITKFIQTRQSILKQMHKCLNNIFSHEETFPTFKEQIKHYRKLTVLTIKAINEWLHYLKDIVQPSEEQHIQFMWKQQDYLIKILTDTKFLADSFLNRQVQFSLKNDPFIMRPFVSSSNNSRYAQLFQVQQAHKQSYLECLHILARERADLLKRKVMVREDKIKQIQKIYQTKQDQLTTSLFVKKIKLINNRKQKQQIAPIDFLDDQLNRGKQYNQQQKSRSKQISYKSDKIKKIKDTIFSPYGLINTAKFSTIESKQPKQQYFSQKKQKQIHRSISLNFKQKSKLTLPKQENHNYDTDFQQILRQKELKVLQNDNTRRRTHSSIKLKDRLSERKLVNNKEGAAELEEILSHLDQHSPQKLQHFMIRKQQAAGELNQSPLKITKTLVQHNEEVVMSLREKILKQIKEQQQSAEQAQKRRKEQNEKIQQIIRQKMQKQTLQILDLEKQKKTEGKTQLAGYLGKQMFGYEQKYQKSRKLTDLEQQLRKEMQLKWLRQVHDDLQRKTALDELAIAKRKEGEQIQKQYSKTLTKKQQQQRFKQIQLEQRTKIMKEEEAREQARKKQIQKQMYEIIEKQKQRLEQYSNQQKEQLELEMKQIMKLKILQNLKKQKQSFMQRDKKEIQNRKKQQAFRQQIREKIQKSFNIEKELQNQRKRQQKSKKIKMVAMKMDHLGKNLQESKLKMSESNMNQSKLLDSQIKEARTNLANFPQFKSNSPIKKISQDAKKKMRQNFEIQLFAFKRPQIYEQQESKFLLKDYKKVIDNQENLNKKIQQQAQVQFEKQQLENLQVIQFNNQSKKFILDKNTENNQSRFEKFTEVAASKKQKQTLISQQKLQIDSQDQRKRLKMQMSYQQYEIYKKKKAAINKKRDTNRIEQIQKQRDNNKKLLKMIDQFQILPIIQSNQEETQNIQNNKKKQLFDALSQQVVQKPYSQEEPNKKILKKQEKFIPPPSSELSEVMRLTVHSKLANSRNKRFITSDEDEDDFYEEKEEIVKKKKQNEKQKNYKNNKKQKIQQQIAQDVYQKVNNQKILTNKVLYRKLSVEKLQPYVQQHYKNLPKLIKRLNLLKKDQLLKTLLEQKSFTILQIIEQSKCIGITFFHHNENKTNLRSHNIIHIGAYEEKDIMQCVIKSKQYIFQQDPAEQVTFSMFYDKEVSEHNDFIKFFEQKFDPYGAIFQKKIFNSEFERKHVMRRLVGENFKHKLQIKNNGTLRIKQQLFCWQKDLGVQPFYSKIGADIGGYLFLSIFLNSHVQKQAIMQKITKEVHSTSPIKHLSQMAVQLYDIKIKDVEFQSFSNPFQLNLRLVQKSQQVLKCDPKIQQTDIKVTWGRLNIEINLAFNFVTSSAQFYHQQHESEYICRYLRITATKNAKIYKLKSKVYSSVVTVLPCKPAKYKIFFLDSLEYTNLNKKKQISIDYYLKMLLSNLSSHQLSTDENIWIPQMNSNGVYKMDEARDFGFNSEMRNNVNFTNEQYIDNSVDYQPTHRDLFITPPYIWGVLNSQIQKSSEGSPIYLERIDVSQLSHLIKIKKPIIQSD